MRVSGLFVFGKFSGICKSVLLDDAVAVEFSDEEIILELA